MPVLPEIIDFSVNFWICEPYEKDKYLRPEDFKSLASAQIKIEYSPLHTHISTKRQKFAETQSFGESINFHPHLYILIIEGTQRKKEAFLKFEASMMAL